MNTQVQQNIQRVLITATVLVLIGGGLNIFVMQTLGSFDAASVILALYVAAWAFVLGDIGLILSALWLFMKRRGLAGRKEVEPGARDQVFQEAERALGKPCHAC